MAPKSKATAKSRSRSRTPKPGRSVGQFEGFYEFDSDLCLFLVKRWCWKARSAPEIQAEAEFAYNDQIALLNSLKLSRDYASRTLREFSRLGAHGRYPNNIKRDKEPAIQEVAFPILPPHKVFKHLYEEYPDRFKQVFLGGNNPKKVLNDFWAEAL